MRTHNILTAECSNAGWVSNPNVYFLVRTVFFCLLSHVLLPHLKERCRNVCLCISCVYRNIGRYIDTRIFKSLILQQSQSSALAPKICCVLICTLFDLIQTLRSYTSVITSSLLNTNQILKKQECCAV